MVATLTIRDETTSPLDDDRVFTLDLPAERVTVGDVIRARVHREVEDYNARRPECFRGLVQPTNAERTLNGFRVRERRRIDPEEQATKAVEAFGCNRFLLLTYRFHLSSGNILTEPNGQYLCIVPSQAAANASGKVYLPFEGDSTLTIILSKAFQLAEDRWIKDPTILHQIRR